MPHNVTPQFLDTFGLYLGALRVAEADLDKRHFVVEKMNSRQAGFMEVGKLGAFFTSKAKCRMAGQALLATMQANYGDAVAAVVEQDLRDVLVKGKPLTARKVLDVFAYSEKLSTRIRCDNARLLSNFFQGKGATGPDVLTFDKLVSQYCTQHGINGDADAVTSALRSHVCNELQGSTKMLTVEDIRRAISSAPPLQIQNHAAASSAAAVNDFNVRFLSATYGLSRRQGEAILSDVRDKVAQMALETKRLHTYDTITRYAKNITHIYIFSLSGQKAQAISELAAKFGLRDPAQLKQLEREVDSRLSGLVTAQQGKGYGYPGVHFSERITVESLYDSIVKAEPWEVRNALKGMGFDEQRIEQTVSPPPAPAAAEDHGSTAAAAGPQTV